MHFSWRLRVIEIKDGRVQEISVLIKSASSEGSGESALVQTCQSLRCLHPQSMDVDEGSDSSFAGYISMGIYLRHIGVKNDAGMR